MNIIISPSTLKDNSTVSISGHKHSFVQIVAAAIILNQRCKITNVPATDDAFILAQLIQDLGGQASFEHNIFCFDPTSMRYKKPNSQLCAKIHGSLYFIFALTIRFNRFVPLKTGGCQIGKGKKRPDSHLIAILKDFGTVSRVNDSEYKFAPNTNKRIKQNILKFSDRRLWLSGEKVSSATKLSMLAALRNPKDTIIRNYYFRTDVLDLLEFIKLSGATVVRDSQSIKIDTTSIQHKTQIVYRLSDCQSEVITFITLAIMCNIKLTLKLKNTETLCKILQPELKLFNHIGLNLTFRKNAIVIPNNQFIKSARITIKQKGIQSDHQPFLTLLLTKASKRSSVTETVWKSRFLYADELNKLGTRFQIKGNKIIVYPGSITPKTSTICLTATDTRAAAVLVIDALAAQSYIKIKHAEHLNRGYDGFLQKLEYLGANITQ